MPSLPALVDAEFERHVNQHGRLRSAKILTHEIFETQKILTHVTYVSGWEPAVYLSYMGPNFRLFLASNLSVQKNRFFLLMYPGSMIHALGSGNPPLSAD